MGKYKKRALLANEPGAGIIEAIKFDGTLSGWKKIQSAFPGLATGGISYNETTDEIYLLNISNANGNHGISAGDYIVKDVNGEYFSCKPDTFDKNFEPVGGTDESNWAMFDKDRIFSLI